MKKAALIFTMSLLLAACFSQWQPGDAVITLRLGGHAGRAAGFLPAPDEEILNSLVYKVQLSGPSGEQTRNFQEGARTVQITVVPGSWDITLWAYLDEKLYAEGAVKGFNVKAGQSNTVVIDMFPPACTCGEGGDCECAERGVECDCEACALVTEVLEFYPFYDYSDYDVIIAYGVRKKNEVELIGPVYIPPSYNNLPVTEIGEGAFRDCYNLSGITIPAGVTTIGRYAFAGCTGIAEISIPATVRHIGSGAFDRWSDEGRQQKIFIAGHANYDETVAAGWAADWQAGIKTDDTIIYLGDKPPPDTSDFEFMPINSNGDPVTDSIMAVAYSVRKKDGVELSGELIIPASFYGKPVTSINEKAFKDCTGITGTTLPASVTSIGSEAFSGCTSIEEITIPATVTEIGEGAFYNWTADQTINVPFDEDSNHPSEWDTFWSGGNAKIVYIVK